MFWYISFLLICTYLFGNENGDLSGEIYKDNVKVIEVLDKIEQLEKDGDKVYWNKIVTVKNQKMISRSVLLCKSDNQRK